MTVPLIYEPWFKRSEYESRLSRLQAQIKQVPNELAFQRNRDLADRVLPVAMARSNSP